MFCLSGLAVLDQIGYHEKDPDGHGACNPPENITIETSPNFHPPFHRLPTLGDHDFSSAALSTKALVAE